jgi:squalene cyclase
MKDAIQIGIDSLSQVVREFLYKDIELLRVCRTAVLLKECGVNPYNNIFNELAQKCVKNQRKDGGWTDVEETLWCSAFLDIYENHSYSVNEALIWLEKQENKDGCWGRSDRDQARIPLTALMLKFLPQLNSAKRLKWLENKWNNEQKMHPNLTYKVALTIMAFSLNNYIPENNLLINNSISWLCEQQNNDGGWGPWKNHPVGSDPWCTGICLVSLIDFHKKVPVEVLKNGLRWILEKQLPDGFWPYHYIEDGSSWALYGLINGNKLLNG